MSQRTWTKTIRVEHRNGQAGYVILFSDGRLFAALRSFAGPAVDLAEVKGEAERVSSDWLSHIHADNYHRKSGDRRAAA